MAEEKNIKLVLEYDGSCYHGWQRQTSLPTLQELLEKKIETMTGEKPLRQPLKDPGHVSDFGFRPMVHLEVAAVIH